MTRDKDYDEGYKLGKEYGINIGYNQALKCASEKIHKEISIYPSSGDKDNRALIKLEVLNLIEGLRKK